MLAHVTMATYYCKDLFDRLINVSNNTETGFYFIALKNEEGGSFLPIVIKTIENAKDKIYNNVFCIFPTLRLNEYREK